MSEKSENKPYRVWRCHPGSITWIKTAHEVTGRSHKEAQARLQRRFADAGFSSMSLLAVLEGQDPNQGISA